MSRGLAPLDRTLGVCVLLIIMSCFFRAAWRVGGPRVRDGDGPPHTARGESRRGGDTPSPAAAEPLRPAQLAASHTFKKHDEKIITHTHQGSGRGARAPPLTSDTFTLRVHARAARMPPVGYLTDSLATGGGDSQHTQRRPDAIAGGRGRRCGRDAAILRAEPQTKAKDEGGLDEAAKELKLTTKNLGGMNASKKAPLAVAEEC